MNTFRPFQIGLIAVFGVLAVIAIVVLTTYQAKQSAQQQAYGSAVVIWGTLPQDTFRNELEEISKTDKAFNVVSYRQIDPASFDYEFINAIAEGHAPDLVLLSSNALVTHRSKLIPITAATISDRTFKDTYIDGASIFKMPEGLYGLPFAVDPLVMYWNPGLFSSNGLSQAPATWEALVADVPHLTVVDDTKNVIHSGLAFGEYTNVTRAKEILLLLALQTGSKMVTVDTERYHVTLNEPIETGLPAPLEVASQFYTDFSNPVNVNQLYSWNRAMPQDKTAFLAGDLATYFGRGSEYTDIAEKNPNLSFDVAKVPQGTNATALRTFGEFYAFAIPKVSKNTPGAFAVANILTSKDVAAKLTQALNLAPVRRDLLAQKDPNAYRQIILDSALIARGWLDPGAAKSDDLFKKLIEDIDSNVRVTDAVADAINRLTLAY